MGHQGLTPRWSRRAAVLCDHVRALAQDVALRRRCLVNASLAHELKAHSDLQRLIHWMADDRSCAEVTNLEENNSSGSCNFCPSLWLSSDESTCLAIEGSRNLTEVWRLRG